MDEEVLKILLIKDGPDDPAWIRSVLAQMTGDSGQPFCEVTEAATLAGGLERLAVGGVDVALLALSGPQGTRLETFKRVSAYRPEAPVLVLLTRRGSGLENDFIQSGAQDCLVEGEIDDRQAKRSILFAIDRQRRVNTFHRHLMELRHREARWKGVAEHNPDALLVMDENRSIHFANPATQDLTGVKPELLIGQSLSIPLEPQKAVEMNLTRKDGKTVAVEVRAAPMPWKEHRIWVVALRDISARKGMERTVRELNEQLRASAHLIEKQALSDPVTGSLNRRGLAKAVEDHLVSESEIQAIFVDLENLDAINEQFSYRAGDTALREIASRLRTAVGASHPIGRITGGQFLILISDPGPADAAALTDQVLKAVSQTPLRIGGAEVGLHAHAAGVSLRPSGLDDLILAGHRQISEARQAQRKAEAPPSPEEAAPSARREPKVSVTVDEFRNNARFLVVSQPIVQLRDEKVVGYEFFSRLVSLPMELPEEFFTFTFESHLLASVDHQCYLLGIRKAEAAPRNALIHLNLFSSTILEYSVADILGRLPPKRPKQDFCLEINREHLPADVAHLARRCQAFKRSGVRIGLNSVETTPEAADLVRRLEPDVIKLDRAVVNGIAEDSARQAALREWTGSFSPSARLAAVGIESRADMEALKHLGVHYGQGFYFGQPKQEVL
ncbi:MAG: EAL domain-containing protein [Planctomycetes bacterium]|nr:EAL domain-containing protein [Planctomycetota bacterium]